MDVVSDVLSWLRVEGTLSRRSEFSAPWGVAYAPVASVSFMVVESGRCCMLLDGRAVATLETGDVVMFSPGTNACLVDAVCTPAIPYTQVLEECTVVDADKYTKGSHAYPTIRYGGGGAETALRGWGLRFEGYDKHPLLSILPPFVHITHEQRAARPWLETTVQFLLQETYSQQDGSDMMIVRLVDLLFVQVIRAWVAEQPPESVGWLGALRDGFIRHGLTLIHQYPADSWTVESLAKTVGMSRSSFSSRFHALVGSSPLKYLTQLRMHLAAIALKRDAQRGLGDIARQVGYESESSFGRAFKRHFGVSPGVYRRR